VQCPRCGKDEGYLIHHSFMDRNTKIAQFFYVGLVLFECPCGYRRFDQLHFTIPLFPKTEFILSKEGLKVIELGGEYYVWKGGEKDKS